MIKPEEYAIIKATLPLVAELKCNGHSMCFSHFWHLPPQMRAAVSQYKIDDPQTSVFQFEIYGDEHRKGGLLVLGFSSDDIVGTDIECLGQYLPLADKFVRQPHPVNDAMLDKMQAMVHERWSLKKLSSRNELVWWQKIVALAALAGWIAAAFVTLHAGEWVILAFVSIMSLLSALQVGEGWYLFRKRRLEITKELQRYVAGIPQGFPAD